MLTIVIPHKDTPQKLRRLLRSIPLLDGLKVIVVDDGSEEDAKASALAVEFPGFKFLDNPGPNFNAGAARNIGLRLLDTPWVCFADADDYFVEDGVLTVLERIQKASDKIDIVFFDVTSEIEGTGKLGSRHTKTSALLSTSHASKCGKMLRYCRPAPWAKAIRSKVLTSKGIRFDEVSAGNDAMFSLLSGRCSREIAICRKVIYCITESNDSLTAKLTPDRALSRLDVLTRSNINLMQWRIDVRFHYGLTFFKESRPWQINLRKVPIYLKYLWMILRRPSHYFLKKDSAMVPLTVLE